MLSPAQMASAVEEAMHHKATTSPLRSLLLAFSGGGYIALGFVFYTTSQVGADALPWGVAKVIAGLVFSFGLALVVLTGSDLFTSTTMTLMAKASGLISWLQLFRHWGLVYVGNAIGALTVVALCYFGGLQDNAGGQWGEVVVATATTKVGHTWFEAFVLGIGCNILVCAAVWTAFAGRGPADKILAVMGPVAIFVASGFEHSVANMFMIPYGLFLGGNGLTWDAFLLANLIPVTLGNIVGGGAMIGLYYWVIFRRKDGRVAVTAPTRDDDAT
ncbi:MAG TPA: formate transporter [Actinomycetales bacterium]|nr:formate transporter [Actinomycetales bacterium]